jgi:cell wall-associated NlpC family hydrolase
MTLGARYYTRTSARVLFQATAYSLAVVAAVALFATAGAVSPAMAQASKAPPKAKVKPVAKAKTAPADPTDRMADELNARWQQDNNNAFAGFTAATPAAPAPQAAGSKAAVTPVAFSTGPAAPNAAGGNEWGDKLVSRAMNYLGTPYRYGGISPQTGFDCSGFVYYLYGAVFGQRIPRMPHDMVREATPVARNDLQKGDLVMFGYRGAITHVGIYSGNNQFVHATHRGSPVMVTSLDADYYNTRYLKAVRLTP